MKMKHEELRLIEFQRRFPTEEACQKHLYGLRWPDGYKCSRCGKGKAYFLSKRHLYQCRSCGYQASLTSRTIFHKTRTPLTKWFWMILLMGRQKAGISMLSLKRMLNIGSYKTVLTMGNKIKRAMKDKDAYYKLAGLVEMENQVKGGNERDVNRSSQ